MKKQLLIAGNIALCLLAAGALHAAETTTLGARSGSKMRIEGTSNIHDWQVESLYLGGSLQVGKGFPLQPGDVAAPGKVEATGEVIIPVRSLKSIEKNGAHYSDKMDTVMNEEHLLADKFPKITYHLTELMLKEVPKDKTGAYAFDSKGELAVTGVTNKISMPVNITPLGPEKENRIKITGTISLKMTDFKITPPAPAIAGGLIKTGDEVKLIFEWQVAPKKAAK
jgi:polyisoprenoid-binding protein YceI